MECREEVSGNRHQIIALVRQATASEAENMAIDALSRTYWELPEVKRVAPLDPNLGISTTVEDAISDAAVHGVSLIVYDIPIAPHST
jgi:hypothetical protein